MPRCDAHHHFFASGTGLLEGATYSVDEFARDVATVDGVDSTVHVQARNAYDQHGPADLAPVGETRWLVALRRPANVMTRCVGFADLTLGAAVGLVLDAHLAAGPAIFAGVRHAAAWSKDPALRLFAGSLARPGLLTSSAYSQGVAEVHRRGLTFETWVFSDQLDDLRGLAGAHPDGPVIVDHLGGPCDTGSNREEALAQWRQSMAALAAMEHVRVKLSGVGMSALTPPGRLPDPIDAERIAAYWGPELRWCIETFGPQRCLLGTNFPVDRALCDYATMWAAFDLVIAGYSPAEQEQVRCGTAEQVYGVPAPSGVRA